MLTSKFEINWKDSESVFQKKQIYDNKYIITYWPEPTLAPHSHDATELESTQHINASILWWSNVPSCNILELTDWSV